MHTHTCIIGMNTKTIMGLWGIIITTINLLTSVFMKAVCLPCSWVYPICEEHRHSICSVSQSEVQCVSERLGPLVIKSQPWWSYRTNSNPLTLALAMLIPRLYEIIAPSSLDVLLPPLKWNLYWSPRLNFKPFAQFGDTCRGEDSGCKWSN